MFKPAFRKQVPTTLTRLAGGSRPRFHFLKHLTIPVSDIYDRTETRAGGTQFM
jgi:hypothetical protein